MSRSRGDGRSGRERERSTLGTALASDLRDDVSRIGRADIVVGIPSFNNAGTIGHVAAAAREGLRRSFPSLRAAIVNSDGGSDDGTRDVMREASTDEVPVATGRYAGPPGKGSALRAVFEAALVLGARGAAVVDSDLRSITPEWIDRLLRPVIEGRAAYVTPLYIRHKYDGTITNTLVYPVVRALYGQRVRQPIGGDFGFSAAMAERYLAEDVWESDVARFGIDVFMTTTALASGATVVQAALGAKIHDPKDPARHLAPMFTQVYRGLVGRVSVQRAFWERVRGSVALATEGAAPRVEPGAVQVDLAGLDTAFRLASASDRDRWRRVLCPDDLDRFVAGAGRAADPDLERPWARLVYDAIAASIGGGDAAADASALLPLYFARVAMHVRATGGLSSSDAETLVERQAATFEVEKPHLMDRLA